MSEELEPVPLTEPTGDPATTEPTSLITEPTAEPTPEVTPLAVEDLTPIEGFEFDTELSTEFLGLLNNNEMDPKERANALIQLHQKTIEATLSKESEAWGTMQNEWRDAAKNDPDIGGAKLQPALTDIAKLVDEYGSNELRGVLDLTGAGNNVHVIKFLSNIATALVEPSPNPGNPKPAGDTSPAQRLFPSMKG